MKQIVVFDFDGTLINRDSFIEFIKFSKGRRKFYLTVPLIGMAWLMSKLKIVKTHLAKEYIFSFFFKNMTMKEFDNYCEDFSYNVNLMLRKRVEKTINDYLINKDTVIIVSGSIENWIKPWATSIGIINVIATKVEVDKYERLTGKFSSENCVGKEKVKRFLELYPDFSNYKLIVYGDSLGDKELINIADKSYWREFSKSRIELINEQ